MTPYLTQYEEQHLALSLADHLKPHMSRVSRAQTFARIGAGDVIDAIVFLAECCQKHGVEYSKAVVKARFRLAADPAE